MSHNHVRKTPKNPKGAGRRKNGTNNVSHPGRECEWCGGPIPSHKNAGAKYCQQRCISAAAKRRLKDDPSERRIDTFGFLTRKGLAA